MLKYVVRVNIDKNKYPDWLKTHKPIKDWDGESPLYGAGKCYSLRLTPKLEMAAAGIYTTTADASTLDEAPNAYKPMEEIVKYIEPTVNILYFMKPMMNIKASDTKEDED